MSGRFYFLPIVIVTLSFISFGEFYRDVSVLTLPLKKILLPALTGSICNGLHGRWLPPQVLSAVQLLQLRGSCLGKRHQILTLE